MGEVSLSGKASGRGELGKSNSPEEVTKVPGGYERIILYQQLMREVKYHRALTENIPYVADIRGLRDFWYEGSLGDKKLAINHEPDLSGRSIFVKLENGNFVPLRRARK